MEDRLDQCADDWPPERAAAARERIGELFGAGTEVVPLSTALDALGVPGAAAVAAACAERVESMPSLPQAMSLALASYITALTYVPAPPEDRTTAPAQLLRAALLSEDAAQLAQARPFLLGVVSALRVLPRTRYKALYRVVARAADTAKLHQKGAIIAWPCFVSTTPSLSRARALARAAAAAASSTTSEGSSSVPPVLYALTGDHVWGYDVAPYAFGGAREPEAVVEPGLEFFVAGRTAAAGLVEVTLRTTPFFTLVLADAVPPNPATVPAALDDDPHDASEGDCEGTQFINSHLDVVAAREPKPPPAQRGQSLLERFGAPPVVPGGPQYGFPSGFPSGLQGSFPGRMSTAEQMSALARSADGNPVSLVQNFEALQRCAGRQYPDDARSLREEAMYLSVYRAAAQCGSPLAQYKLGMFALAGLCTPVCAPEAVACFRAAAARGVRDAQLQLGLCAARDGPALQRARRARGHPRRGRARLRRRPVRARRLPPPRAPRPARPRARPRALCARGPRRLPGGPRAPRAPAPRWHRRPT